MKKIFYLILFIFNITNASSIESKIIYVIENEIITNVDIKNEFKYISALNSQLKDLPKEKIFNIARESIIREKIKKVEILKNFKNLDVNEEYLDLLIKNIYNNLKINSHEEFKNYLKNYNLQIRDIEEKIKIEALWNELIIKKYNSKININIEQIKRDIKNTKSLINKNYLLSEIVFEIKDTKKLNEKYILIKKSTEDIGFKNTASIYSISDTSKIGGNIGWINERSLSKAIYENIYQLKKGEISKPLIIPGGVLILKINDIKNETMKLDPEKELERIVNFKKNKQLNQYSKIYFNKVKKNQGLSE
ncbi:peptidylprolyl isomerase [Candidatus Pelagibacter sp.]|jgi:peptidyl-prolyl cis-trans isomerase SurA|nr:peptidylprolyl isomerase [Candidatus Pelagibacter sp.]